MAGGNPARAILVERPQDLGQVLRVLRDQDFFRADIRYDARRRCLSLPLQVRFGADRGIWYLEIYDVDRWHHASAQGEERDVLRDLRYDKKAGTVTIVGLLDRMVAKVDRLDVRAELEADDGPAGHSAAVQGYEDLPAQVRHEAQLRQAKQAQVYARADEQRKRLSWRAALVSSALTMILVAIAGGHLLVLLIACPVVSGGLAYACARHHASPFAGMFIMGVAGFVLLGMAVNLNASGIGLVGPLIHVFFGGLIHIAFGGILMHWMREEESIRI